MSLMQSVCPTKAPSPALHIPRGPGPRASASWQAPAPEPQLLFQLDFVLAVCLFCFLCLLGSCLLSGPAGLELAMILAPLS